MNRRVRGETKISTDDMLRNKRISKKRSPGERPFGVMKRVMHGGYTYLTELHRVFNQELLTCFAYNLLQMETASKEPNAFNIVKNLSEFKSDTTQKTRNLPKRAPINHGDWRF